jgi:hypothetical protein
VAEDGVRLLLGRGAHRGRRVYGVALTGRPSLGRAGAIVDQAADRLRALPRFGAMDRMYPVKEPSTGPRGRLSPLVVYGAILRDEQRLWGTR